MPRRARVVIPGWPHHIIQRGNRRQRVFFEDSDYKAYKELLAEWSKRCGLSIWAYCLMSNHLHVIAFPAGEATLKRVFKEVHVRYTRRINFRKKWRGCLWEGRFKSYSMDERYLVAAARYVELNPVKARMVKDPGAYRWSSAKAHLTGKDDGLVEVRHLLAIAGNWRELLDSGMPRADQTLIEAHMKTGLPLGRTEAIQALERRLKRPLRRKKPGRKPQDFKSPGN